MFISDPFQRAVLKFASATGATTFHGRFTPGTFTNQIQAAFREPRLLIVTDPRADHQPLTEASYVNIPTIALCNTDSPLRYVDIAIPCNNKVRTKVFFCCVNRCMLHTVRARRCLVCAVRGVGRVLNKNAWPLTSSLWTTQGGGGWGLATKCSADIMKNAWFNTILLVVIHGWSVTVLQGHHSVGLMWWMLAREVLRMRGTISREHPWEVMPDLYFYRDPEEVR